MAARVTALLDPPIGFAHRGARAHATENTLEAFELAHRMGATGIETDAWITADGQIVLDHDGVVHRGLLRRRIANLQRSQLPEHIPTIDEYYERCGTALPLSVDVKDDAVFTVLIAAAHRHGAAERLWICHPDLAVLTGWRDAAGEAKLVHSTRLPKAAERHAADLASAGVDAVNLRRDDWSGGLTTLYHRFGVLAFGWDAQQTRHIVELLYAGVDGVYSDHVDRLVSALAHFTPDADP